MSYVFGPLKNEAIDDLRKQVRGYLEYMPLVGHLSLGKATDELFRLGWKGMCDLDMFKRVRDDHTRTWVNKVMENDAAAWEAARDGFNSWAFGCALPPDTPEEEQLERLHSWLPLEMLKGRRIILAKDEYGTFPPKQPSLISWVGTHYREQPVYAAARVDKKGYVGEWVFYHPTDPDAALWAAIEAYKSL